MSKLFQNHCRTFGITGISFDSSMMNGLQAVDSWDECEHTGWLLHERTVLTGIAVFHSPRSTLLGLMSSMYSLGAIISLPLVPVITDGLGRRRAIVFGSVIMIIGAIIQTCARNCMPALTYAKRSCQLMRLVIQMLCSSSPGSS